MSSPNNNIPRTCGAFVGGDLTVHGDLNTFVSAEPSSSHASAAETSPFRCNLPTPTRHYKGRREILDKISNHFTDEPDDPTNCWGRTVVIVGLGGIGKSETACKFANENRKVYPCAAWIDAETEQNALDSFLSLAKKLQIVSEGRQWADLELVKKVYHHIDAHYPEKVLFIFDNANKLRSDENDFGIFDYLPTEDLANQRFPFVVITSQTPSWQKGIKTFQLEELSEEESLSFFRSAFEISSFECDQAFKKLHIQLQGYPLAMTLAASNIDFEFEKDSFLWLQEQIDLYVEKFEKEDSTILTQKINQNWPGKYNKTLSTVWQLSFQRLQADHKGKEALMLLQAISFFDVPVSTQNLERVFTECPYCPGTPDWMQNDRLKESIRLLQRFHLVDSVFGALEFFHELKALQSNTENNLEDVSRKFEAEVECAKPFWAELRIHRLVQLVVRLHMDCSVVLEDILRFLAFWARTIYVRQLNTSAVEEGFGRARLSTRALGFVGLLALRGNRAARRIVKTSTAPVDDPAATIWRVLQLDKCIQIQNKDAIQVLREFVGLSTSETCLIGKRCYAFMSLDMCNNRLIFPHVLDDGIAVPGIFLESFTEIEGIASELFSIGCAFTDVCSLPLLCTNVRRASVASWTLILGNKIVEDLTKAKKPQLRIANIREELNKYRELVDRGKSQWHQYYEELTEIFDSVDSWKKFESEVKACGFNRRKLMRVFSSMFYKIWLATGNRNFCDVYRFGHAFRSLDFIIYKFVKTPRNRKMILALMDSFIDVLVKTEQVQLSALQNPAGNPFNIVVWICTTCMKFCIQEGCLSSKDLSSRLSRVRMLAEMKRIPIDRIRDILHPFCQWNTLEETHKMTYDTFMQMHSESSVEHIRTLVSFCREIQQEISRAAKQFEYDTDNGQLRGIKLNFQTFSVTVYATRTR